jgi:hypothetical protein
VSKALEKIHNINPLFNRIFSVPIFIGAWITLVVYLFLPYALRIVFALLINLFFNRPIVYLNYFARFIARPLHLFWTSVLYFVFFGAYAIIGSVFGLRRDKFGAASTRWVPSEGTVGGRDHEGRGPLPDLSTQGLRHAGRDELVRLGVRVRVVRRGPQRRAIPPGEVGQ